MAAVAGLVAILFMPQIDLGKRDPVVSSERVEGVNVDSVVEETK